MKKLLLITLGFFSLKASAQCRAYECSNQTVVCDELENVSYQGSKCFGGEGIIKASVSLNNWTYLAFEGDLNVKTPINYSANKRVYIKQGADIHLLATNFASSDTLWNAGDLIIDQWTSNNSNSNVIMLKAGATLKIGNTYYNNPPYTLNVVGNPTNKLLIRSCGLSALPIVLEYFTYPLSFSFLKVDDLYKVDILYSKDGNSFENLQSFYSCLPNIQYKSDFNYQGWYKLRMIDFQGQESYSQTLRVQGTIQSSSSQAYDILGRKTTPKDLYIQNNKLNFKY